MIGKKRSLAISTFLEDKIEEIKKVDIDIWKDKLTQVSYRDALLNVTKLWLLSRRYDRVRQPDWAGFFDGLLREYPMTEEGARRVESALSEAINEKIPDIIITSVKAVPDLVKKGWNVYVKTVDTDTNLSTAWAEDQALEVFIASDASSVETLDYAANKQAEVVQH